MVMCACVCVCTLVLMVLLFQFPLFELLNIPIFVYIRNAEIQHVERIPNVSHTENIHTYMSWHYGHVTHPYLIFLFLRLSHVWYAQCVYIHCWYNCYAIKVFLLSAPNLLSFCTNNHYSDGTMVTTMKLDKKVAKKYFVNSKWVWDGIRKKRQTISPAIENNKSNYSKKRRKIKSFHINFKSNISIHHAHTHNWTMNTLSFSLKWNKNEAQWSRQSFEINRN